MRTKKEMLKRLNTSPNYKRSLTAIIDPAVRQGIIDTVESFVSGFADVLCPMIERAQSDPEFARQLCQALSEDRTVVTTEPVPSGSLDG